MQNILDGNYKIINLINSTMSFLYPKIGEYKMSCQSNDYSGWIICDGRSLSKEDYSTLFQLVGTTFGTTSIDTFKIPDYRGKVMGGVGQGFALTNRELGDDVGSETHTLGQNEMPVHSHTGTTNLAGSHSHTTNAVGGGSAGLVISNGAGTTVNTDADGVNEINTTIAPIALNVDSAGDHTHTFTTSASGSGQPHNNMQPTLFGGNIFIYSG